MKMAINVHIDLHLPLKERDTLLSLFEKIYNCYNKDSRRDNPEMPLLKQLIDGFKGGKV